MCPFNHGYISAAALEMQLRCISDHQTVKEHTAELTEFTKEMSLNGGVIYLKVHKRDHKHIHAYLACNIGMVNCTITCEMCSELFL